MDSFKGAVGAAYSDKSETSAFENIHSWQIPISFNNFRILNNNERTLDQVLQMKFDCLSTLDSPCQEDDSSNSLQVYKKMLTAKLELSVWKGDLTKHSVDAVVNAANQHLLHDGGLAYALVKAGGSEIQEDSKKYILQHGKLSVGEIAVTPAWRLPCKKLIHAVGPQWLELKRDECVHLLEKAITNILRYVTKFSAKIETVAIPAISSGIFCFPLRLCTYTIVETIRTYFQENQFTGNLKEIHLVSNEDATVDAFKAVAELILERNQLGPWVTQETKTCHQMVVNNVTLQIVQDYIEMQKTDVIVNSLYLFSNLCDGPVSKAILRKAGKEMENELSQKMNDAVKDKELLLVTRGYNLTCRHVYHVLWDQSYPQQSKMLSTAVSICLTKCISENETSISFPALGAGHISLSKYQVARTMFNEVLALTSCNFEKHLTVNFVIIPTDKELWEVFINEMEKQKSMLHNHNYKATGVSSVRQSTETKRKSELRASSPAINLMGTNLQKMIEAEVWILRTLSLQEYHVIENNHIFYLGKKEHDILSGLQTSKVSISENIIEGKAYLEIKGPQADLIKVVMHIELLLCEVQEERAKKKEDAIWSLIGPSTNQQPKSQDTMGKNTFLKMLNLEAAEIRDQRKQFENSGLQVIKVEKIDNMGLTAAFQKTKMMTEKKAKGSALSHRLFQQVPYQFCDVVSRVGFQRMYSKPSDPTFRAGIYFTNNLKHLANKAKATSVTDKFIYVFEAEVLTGFACLAPQSQIFLPPLIPGGIESYDSMIDSTYNPEDFVIFNCMQALPQYLWTCTQNPSTTTGTVFSPHQQWNEFPGDSYVYQTQQNSFSPKMAWRELPSGSSVD